MSPAFMNIGMFLLYWMVFTLFFLLVPNRRVQIKHALIGAFLSTVLFELAKAGFVGYVSNTNYKVIYGALATIPIFLFWLYLVWIVVLFGASLAASLTTFSDYSRYETEWPERWEFQLAFRLLGHLFNAQREGVALSREQFLELEPQASELQIIRLLSQLRKQNVVSLDDAGDCLLSRDLEDLTLGNLYEYGDYFLPLGNTAQLPVDSDWDRSYVACLKEVYEKGHASWERPLRHMYMRPRAEDS